MRSRLGDLSARRHILIARVLQASSVAMGYGAIAWRRATHPLGGRGGIFVLNAPCAPCAAKQPLVLRQPIARQCSSAFRALYGIVPGLIIFRVEPFRPPLGTFFTSSFVDTVTSFRLSKHRVYLLIISEEHVDGSNEMLLPFPLSLVPCLLSLVPARVHL
jgi:hypothetical protein